MRVIKTCGWRNEILWGFPAAQVSTIIRGCYTGRERQMLQIGPRPKYFPPLKIYFLPSGPLSPSHYSSSISLTFFHPATRPSHFYGTITALHSALTAISYKTRLLFTRCSLCVNLSKVVISIKWLMVKHTTADSDSFLFSLSSYVKTKLWDYTHYTVFQQWRWSWLV